GFLVGFKPFIGKIPKIYEKVHLPSPLMWVPPLILSSLGILFGIFPTLIEATIIKPTVASLINSTPDFHLQLWHGFNLVLLLSGTTMACGTALFFIIKPSETLLGKATRFKEISPEGLFEVFARFFNNFSY